MIAARDLENPPRIRKFALFHVLYPGAVHPQWDFILGLARNCAGVAADAFPIIDNEAVSHRGSSFWKSADFAAI
jgi:hypothetical protein